MSNSIRSELVFVWGRITTNPVYFGGLATPDWCPESGVRTNPDTGLNNLPQLGQFS
ncbi:hypothetical protein MA16_Dca028951 [Dendrobium catenatum]|uniref:Uncharacterized protein n=1 Tax=Dendrobium catenatum TaxID=906689 RepID=A0A2I0VGM2_9ASPA|nr:hypothetical protein MA16_Dca028951 [Dendrobium catenatum]